MHMCDITHSYLWHGSRIYSTRRIHMCETAHSWVRRDSFICVTRLVRHICDENNGRQKGVQNSQLVPILWLTHHIGDTTHSHVWRDSFDKLLRKWGQTKRCSKWSIGPNCVTYSSNMKNDSFTCVTWLVRLPATDMRADERVLKIFYLCRFCDDFTCEIWLNYLCDVTHLTNYYQNEGWWKGATNNSLV